MTTRIRYKKNDSMLTSKPMLAGNDMVVVNLMPVDNKYVIVTLEDGRILASGEGKSANILKIRAKQALRDLGVQFADDVRVRDAEVEGENTRTDPVVTDEGVSYEELHATGLNNDDAPETEEDNEIPPGFTAEDMAEV